MSYTYTINTGDGSNRTFPFSFAGQDNGYLRVTDIKVFVNSVDTPFNIIVSDPNKVVLTTAPAAGAEVLIRRIMPKDVPYADFARGNPFSQDTLNNTNLQMLYNIQEIYDGYLPEGFFFRQNIDMHGFKFVNLGLGTDSGDSVNFDQHDIEVKRNDTQDSRIVILEDAITSTTVINYVSQLYQSTVGGEVTINTTNGLHAAALYINGLFQHKAEGAYMQTGGVITLAEPLTVGDSVYLILGSDLPSEALYVSIDSFNQLSDFVDTLNTQLSDLTTNLGLVTGRVTAIESNYAKKGVNSDITSLTGLTVALPVASGGTGATTATAARSNISAAASGSNSDITKLNTLTGGITGLLTGSAAAAGLVGEEVNATTGAAVNLTTGAIASVLSISLPAGDWELEHALRINNAGNVTLLNFGVNTANNALPANWYDRYNITTTLAAGSSSRQGLSRRVLLSATTTLYLVAQSTFTSTCTADGYIRARRMR